MTIEHDRQRVTQWLDIIKTGIEALPTRPEISVQPPVMIGIKSGGVTVARHLHTALGMGTPLGELNISFYRDDFSTVGLHPVVGPSQVPFSVEGQHVILVDDVLSTGRTVRAAMNEIFDYGRPARITLAVLVQRSGHELPIRADIVGHTVDIPESAHVTLNADSLTVRIENRA